MKGKMFLAHLNTIVTGRQYNIKDLEGVKVLSVEGNVLKCEHEGKEFDFCVDKIVGGKKGTITVFDLIENKPAKKVKKEKPTTEDKE